LILSQVNAMKTMTLAKYKHVRRTDAGAKGFDGSKSKQADVLGWHEEAEVCSDAEQGTLGQVLVAGMGMA